MIYEYWNIANYLTSYFKTAVYTSIRPLNQHKFISNYKIEANKGLMA